MSTDLVALPPGSNSSEQRPPAHDGFALPGPAGVLSAPSPLLNPPGLPAPRMLGRNDEAAGILGAGPVEREVVSGEKITALWSNSASLNSWFYLATAGWKRADPSTASGCRNLTLLAASARQTGAAPHINHDASGIITSMYVW